MRSRLPDSLPSLAGLTLASCTGAFFAALLVADSAFGRPSSTEGLLIPFGMMYTVLAGGIGYVGGILVRALWRAVRRHAPGTEGAGARVLPVYSGLVLLSVAAAISLVWWGERQSAPRVLVLSPRVRAVTVPESGASVRTVALLFSALRRAQVRTAEWDSIAPSVWVIHDTVVVRERYRGLTRRIATPGLDYVVEVRGSVLHGRDGAPFLVLSVTGRASGHRDLFVVLSPTLAVVYEERIERGPRGDPLRIRYDSAVGGEVAVLGAALPRVRGYTIGPRTGP